MQELSKSAISVRIMAMSISSLIQAKTAKGGLSACLRTKLLLSIKPQTSSRYYLKSGLIPCRKYRTFSESVKTLLTLS